MSLTNPSQALLRNTELLTAQNPLLINLPEDGFIDHYIDACQPNSISCFNTNFIDHQAIKTKHIKNQNIKISSEFSSVYRVNTCHDIVIIMFPKSKAELNFTLAMIAHCVDENSKIVFVGEKKGGVQSIVKVTKDILANCQKVDAARHCMVFLGSFKPQKLLEVFNLNEWYTIYEVVIADINLKVASLPGVFSQKQIDIGTKILLTNLPNHMTGNILDFGCGAGVISCFIGKKFNTTLLSLVDVNALAITSAEQSLALNELQGQVFASDSLSNVHESYNHVVSNPPFHQGLKTHYHASESFLSNISKHLKKDACVSIVANSFLRYQPIMQQNIGKTEVITKDRGFTIYRAKLLSNT